MLISISVASILTSKVFLILFCLFPPNEQQILEMKNGEAEYLLQEILHGLSTKQGKRCPIVQFHMHLLSILKTERGEKYDSIS